MGEKLEKIDPRESHKDSQKLKEYIIQKGQGIFRVFVNLGLNYNEKTRDEISKLQDILTKNNGKNETLGIKEGDKYILDADFVVHIERNGKEIYKYSLLKLEEKEKTKTEIKGHTILEIQKIKDKTNEDRLKELVNELDKEARLKYYIELALENNEEEIEENRFKELKPKKDITEKKKREKNEERPQQRKIEEEKKDLKPKKKRERIYLVKPKEHSNGIHLSKEMKKKIWNHIERINPEFKTQLGHVYDIAKEYRLHPALLLAVMQNDSGLGKHSYSKNNPGNIGNTDQLVASGKKGVEFKSPRRGIKAVARNLRERVDNYNDFYPNRVPSVAEIMSGKSREGVEFYGRYMSKKDGPENTEKIYKQIASR